MAINASPPPVPKPVVKTPKAEEVGLMLRRIKDEDPEFAAYLRLAAVTGARPGEMCGLRWSDLDRPAGELDIRRRVVRGEHEVVVKDLTKTGKTRRIPLDRGTLEALDDHRAQMERRAVDAGAVIGEDSYIFSETVDGSGHWRPDSVSRRFASWLSGPVPGASPSTPSATRPPPP